MMAQDALGFLTIRTTGAIVRALASLLELNYYCSPIGQGSPESGALRIFDKCASPVIL